MEKMQARFPPRHEEEKTASGESNVFRAPRPSMRPVALLTGTFSGKAQAMPPEKMRRKPPRLPARRSDEKGSGIFRRSSAALAPSSRTENAPPRKKDARPAPFPQPAPPMRQNPRPPRASAAESHEKTRGMRNIPHSPYHTVPERKNARGVSLARFFRRRKRRCSCRN